MKSDLQTKIKKNSETYSDLFISIFTHFTLLFSIVFFSFFSPIHAFLPTASIPHISASNYSPQLIRNDTPHSPLNPETDTAHIPSNVLILCNYPILSLIFIPPAYLLI